MLVMQFRYMDNYGREQIKDVLAICSLHGTDYVIVPSWQYTGSGSTELLPTAIETARGELLLSLNAELVVSAGERT